MRRVFQLSIDIEADENNLNMEEIMDVLAKDLYQLDIDVRGWSQEWSWSIEDYDNGIG